MKTIQKISQVERYLTDYREVRLEFDECLKTISRAVRALNVAQEKFDEECIVRGRNFKTTLWRNYLEQRAKDMPRIIELRTEASFIEDRINQCERELEDLDGREGAYKASALHTMLVSLKTRKISKEEEADRLEGALEQGLARASRVYPIADPNAMMEMFDDLCEQRKYIMDQFKRCEKIFKTETNFYAKLLLIVNNDV